jgi:hypothetical protein
MHHDLRRLPGPVRQAPRADQPPAGLVLRLHRDLRHIVPAQRTHASVLAAEIELLLRTALRTFRRWLMHVVLIAATCHCYVDGAKRLLMKLITLPGRARMWE